MLTSDTFGIFALNPAISEGQQFMLVLTPSSGPTATYTQTLKAITAEPITITSLLGSTASAVVGTPLTVDWTLLKTFAIAQVRIGTVVYTGIPNDPGTFKCDDQGEQVVLSITSITAQITIPATCNSQTTVQAKIYLQVYGINGELSQVYYTFQ